eukprot:gnl/TRDRNA2_/TRDRNA2_166282_c1_seq2.p1 gnl/TRDRNA2_/TRDRNA2_166282_c1~~gnl/TRDRNA2_/TRDRNA2_166282_c1_seq2.p1  ORF type:complete len:224 (-),score=34.18 gnl/TRDRNA2_/TRDRNA2_166282_c1_seq2:614-1246(-)
MESTQFLSLEQLHNAAHDVMSPSPKRFRLTRSKSSLNLGRGGRCAKVAAHFRRARRRRPVHKEPVSESQLEAELEACDDLTTTDINVAMPVAPQPLLAQEVPWKLFLEQLSQSLQEHLGKQLEQLGRLQEHQLCSQEKIVDRSSASDRLPLAQKNNADPACKYSGEEEPDPGVVAREPLSSSFGAGTISGCCRPAAVKFSPGFTGEPSWS